MTTHGNMAAKKRAFNSAFAPGNTEPAYSKPDSGSASAMYDFDFDDMDTPPTAIAARRASMMPPKTATKPKQPDLVTAPKRTTRPTHEGSPIAPKTSVATSKTPKPTPKKSRPRPAILDEMAADPATSKQTSSSSKAPTDSFAKTSTKPTRKSRTSASIPSSTQQPPSLPRSSTAPSSSTRTVVPKITRNAVSDLYDLPMDDAPPVVTTPISKSTLAQKTTEKRALAAQQPAITSRPIAKPASHKRAQSSAAIMDSAKAAGKTAVNGRIDSYFVKPKVHKNIDTSREMPPPPRRVFSAGSTSLANDQAKQNQPLQPPALIKSSSTPNPPARRLSRGSIPPSGTAHTTPKTTAKPAKKNTPSSNPPKRRRLIDALAAQAEASSESSDGESDIDYRKFEASPSSAIDATPAQTLARPQTRTPLTVRSRGPKKTYASAQRSIRANPRDNDPNHDPFAVPLLSMTVPSNEKDPFDFGDEAGSEEDALPKGTIRSIHELRMAGANNRFADQMDDLFDRIAKPTAQPNSMRRNALLELASLIKDKAFSRQFRDNSAESRLFAQVGQETDIVSGFAIMAILLTLLSSSSMPHLLSLLKDQKVTLLLERLINCDESISELAMQRQTNLSKNGKTTVANLKKDMIQLPIWKGTSISKDLSPRTLALKLMDLYGKPSDMGDYVVSSKPVAESLFSILHNYSDHEWRMEATSDEKLDCLLAASILGAHAMGFEHSENAQSWNTRHFPVVVSVTEVCLSKGKFGTFEHAVLRLLLNMSNNNPGAATATGILALFKNLASAVTPCLEAVKTSLGKFDMSSEYSPFAKLLLILGAMINFSEHCPPVRHSVDEWTEEESPVHGMIDIFLQDHMSTYQADSVEKTQLNVGYGYLSILLAYLCLSRPVRRILEAKSNGKGLSVLRDSVQEFMILQGKVDGGRSHGDHLERIRHLLSELEMGI